MKRRRRGDIAYVDQCIIGSVEHGMITYIPESLFPVDVFSLRLFA